MGVPAVEDGRHAFFALKFARDNAVVSGVPLSFSIPIPNKEIA
jgi:hypothetical protein